jgi:leucyl aminopeptidase
MLRFASRVTTVALNASVTTRAANASPATACFIAAAPSTTFLVHHEKFSTMMPPGTPRASISVPSSIGRSIARPSIRHRAPVRSSTRTFAASGGDYPPGQIQPFGDLVVAGAEALPADAQMLVLSVCEGDAEKLSADDKTLEGYAPGLAAVVKDLVDEQEFKGAAGSSVFTRVAGMPFKHVGLVGLGDADAITGDAWMALGKEATAQATKAKVNTVAVGKYWMGDEEAAFRGKANGIAAGAFLGSFEDSRFKSDAKPGSVKTVHVLTQPGVDVTPEIAAGKAKASGVVLTKQLVAAPPNVVTPTALATVAKQIADAFPETCSVKILEKEECEAMGMGSYLGVSEASDEPPKFIHLTYKAKDAKKTVAVVGKGLTFDSGGYNIKAGAGSMIERMKFDMGGAGATLGAARIIAETAPPGVEAHFIIASCENMIGSRGLRPGDILTASNGKTIEVNNTDAEGRLTLADALVYAEKTAGATSIVDVATLTGAIIVGLGPEVAGIFTPDDELAAELEASAKEAGELFWRMPMQETYWKSCGMTSEFADMKNTGSRGGGAITAALFLKRYIEKKETKWGHLDIAGPVWDDKKGGATGFAAQTLATWIASQGK